jgi:membrane-bound lytic murein transglycosylase B
MRGLKYLALGALAAAAPISQVGRGSEAMLGVQVAIGGAPAFAQPGGLSQAGLEAFLPQLAREARAQGVSQRTIDAIFPSLTFSQRTIDLDRAQPGGASGASAVPPFAPYRQRHLTSALIGRGQQRYAENLGRLGEIGRRYGVHPSVIVAIWGKETSYGTVMGDFDLLNSLASLAYEGRRRQLFTDEFVATLKMVDRGYPRAQLRGSWAGATGHPQFLPTVYIRLAVDGDGDGRADIWRSAPDAWASIANYLSNAGWKPNIPWGVPATVPAGFDRGSVSGRLTAPRCERVHERHSRWLTVAEWRRLGIVPQRPLPDDELASLLEPDGPGQTAYLLTNNYRTILDYNCSNFYALTVGLLADAIAR